MSKQDKFIADRLEQTEKLLDRFRDSLRADIDNFADQALSEVYCNLAPYLETDAWVNLRKEVMADICDYKGGGFEALRMSFLEEHYDRIIKDINTDHLTEIDRLNTLVDDLRLSLKESYRRYS